MIILDTNQLIRSKETLDTPVLTVLKAIGTATEHKLALPDLVVEEFLAHCAREVASCGQDVADRITRLRRLVPTWPYDIPPLPVPATSRTKHGEKLRELFEVLPLPDPSAKAALLREVYRQPPASTDSKHGSGARDAAIWLTVLDAARRRHETGLPGRIRRVAPSNSVGQENLFVDQQLAWSDHQIGLDSQFES